MAPLRSLPPLLLLTIGVLAAAGCVSHAPQETQGAGLSQVTVPAPVTTPISNPGIISKVKTEFPEPGDTSRRVARGDRYYITGDVNDSTETFVAIWIFGRNFTGCAFESVNSDGSYKYEIRQESTNDLEAGPYYIVIQYPGENERFDIQPDLENLTDWHSKGYSCCTGFSRYASGKGEPGIPFEYRGNSCLTDYPAAAALTGALDDPAVDDRYTTDLVMVEDPWIRVNPIGIVRAGDLLLISGTTNLATDDEILVQIYPSWYTPDKCGRILSPEVQKSGYDSGTIKIGKGTGGLNPWNFESKDIHGPDEFRIEISAIIQEADNKTLFRIENNGSEPAPEITRSLPRTGCRTSVPA